MVCNQVWILIFLLQIFNVSSHFNFGDPQKYLICFFQQFKVFKCQNTSMKDNVKIYYYSETGERINVITNDNKCPTPNTPIKIITHGWGGSADNLWYFQMYEFYKKAGVHNVFVVDWSNNAKNINYLQSAADTKCVGDAIGEFIINHLVRHCNTHIKDLHLIGHSLGSHISGFAGKYVQENINTLGHKKIYRITGLDPAGPYFWKCDSQYRLDKEDAIYVDVIHTDEFKFGCTDAIGDFDFYVNGGHAPQPGCVITRKKRSPFSVISCSHSRVTALYAESIISDGFISKKCGNEFLYKFGSCNSNTALIMGEYLNGTLDINISGIYQLQTYEKYPFAKFGKISLM